MENGMSRYLMLVTVILLFGSPFPFPAKSFAQGCSDISGIWTTTDTITLSISADGSTESISETQTDTIEIFQNGCNVSFFSQAGTALETERTGVIQGNTVTFSGLAAIPVNNAVCTKNELLVSGTLTGNQIDATTTVNIACSADGTSVTVTGSGISTFVGTPIDEICKPSDPQFFKNSIEVEVTNSTPLPGSPIFENVVLVARFTPDFADTLFDAAQACGYQRFNWYQEVLYTPNRVTPFIDPPIGQNSDALPFYLDEGSTVFDSSVHITTNLIPSGNPESSSTLEFVDLPVNPFFNPQTPTDYSYFVTSLVGIRADGSYDRLYSWTWKSDFYLSDFTNKAISPAGGGIYDISLGVNPANIQIPLMGPTSKPSFINVSKLLLVPVVQVGEDYYSVVLRLIDEITFDFQVLDAQLLSNPNTIGISIFDNNVLSMSEVIVDQSRYFVEMELVSENPYTFRLTLAIEF